MTDPQPDPTADPTADPDRLRRMLGGEPTAWLLDRIRKRLVAGRPLHGTLTLTTADPQQRRAAERLLGRRAAPGASLTVSLDELDGVLRRSGAAPGGLADVTRLLIGPVPDRAADAAAWATACAPLADLADRRPELAAWQRWLSDTGLVRRLATDPDRATALVSDVVAVLNLLPCDGIGLGTLAARATGHAHGLDDGTPAATLVLAAARVLAGAAPTGDPSAAGRRLAWAAVGVHRDELSSSVLCLGLPGGTRSAVARMLAVAAEAGEPCVLTLRQLRDEDLARDLGVADGVVRVCENPIVLGYAADELGPACPPLLCVSGQPSTAAWRLLRMLTDHGATITYHGDFDWGGIRIGNALHDRIPWRPWRFDAAAYESSPVTGGPLTGRPVPAAWDDGLLPAMRQRGLKIEEELLLPTLLADLHG